MTRGGVSAGESVFRLRVKIKRERTGAMRYLHAESRKQACGDHKSRCHRCRPILQCSASSHVRRQERPAKGA